MAHGDTHRLLHDLFNAKDFDAVEAHLAPGFHYEDLPRGTAMKSSADFKDWMRGWFAAFSDAVPSEPRYLSGPDFSVALFHGRGTNDGELGTLPATGRTMDVPMCEVMHYAADGTVLSGEIYYDQMTMLAQLGHIEPPG